MEDYYIISKKKSTFPVFNKIAYFWKKLIIMPGYFLVVLMLIPNSDAFAQTDSVWFSNGDLIVGEIKSMEEGVLIIETDYSDSDFKTDWNKVIRLKSTESFMISLDDGRRLNGNLFPVSGDSSKVLIRTEEEDVITDYLDMVYINLVNKDLLGRLDASIDIGLTLTKANKLRQYTSRSYIGYTADTWSLSSLYNMVKSVRDSVDATKRTDANIDFKLFLKRDWFINISFDYLQNEEMDLKMRSNVKAGLGNYLIHNYKMSFGVSAGTAWLFENYFTASEESRNSAEAYLGFDINMFNTGDISILSAFYAYPSITERGRIRTDFNIDIKYDLPMDFYVKLGYTYNFDNQPVAGASGTDYIMQTSFGWEL